MSNPATPCSLRIAMYGLRSITPDTSGGVERAVSELTTRLARRGHHVTVFCRHRYNATRQRTHQGVHLVNLPAMYTKHLEAFTHSFLAALCCLRGYDIVHVHATGPALFAILPRLAGRRVVVTMHGLDWRREKWAGFAKTVLRAGAWAALHVPHRTITVSRELQGFAQERYGRMPVFIPNGVAVAESGDPERLGRFGVEKQDYLLYLGRLVPEKGCHLAIDAFRATDTTRKLLIVGSSSHTSRYVERLRQMAAGDDRIVFAGSLYGEDKAAAYEHACALLFPSTLEGMPLVMLEALASGCPVICSDIPENLEVVRPADSTACALFTDTVCVFKSNSAASLQQSLTAFLPTDTATKERAQQLAPQILERFSWERVVDETEALYRDLVGKSTHQKRSR